MLTLRSTSSLLVVLAWLATSCGPPAPPQPTAPAVRAIWLSTSHWQHTEADSASARLQRFVDTIASDWQTLLVPVDSESAGAAPAGFDPLARAIDAGHASGILVYAALRPQSKDGESDAALRQRWKTIARHVASNYDVDGLYLGQKTTSFGAAVEALLVKPWLDMAAPLPVGISGDGPLHQAPRPDSTSLRVWRLNEAQAVALDLSAWVAGPAANVPVHIDSAAHEPATDAAGRIALLLPQKSDSLHIVVGGDSLHIDARYWKPPFDYAVSADGGIVRSTPWVELRATPGPSTTRDVFEFLGRTDPSASARINGDNAHVYGTGVFFDSVALAPGLNRIRLEARGPDGVGLAVYEERVERVEQAPRHALPLWIDERTVEPSDSLALLSDDIVRLSFSGSAGMEATAHIGKIAIPFGRADGDGARASYKADLHLSRLKKGPPHHVEIQLRDPATRAQIKHRIDTPIEVRDAHDFPLVVTSRPESYVSWSLGRARLGGPFVAEYPEGVVLQTNGRVGNRWRLHLGPHGHAYIGQRYADVAPAGTVIPGYFLTNLSVWSTDSTDVVTLPRPEPVPWVVRSDPAGRRIVVTLHGVQTTSTWLSHRSNLRVVDRVTWRQLDAETYEATIHLQSEHIWGYDVRPEGRSLAVTLRHPPIYEPTDDKPLGGLTVAIEAGHGGNNAGTGAIGLSGMFERDVNLATALVLGEMCEAAGADVIQMRHDEYGVPYMARRDSVRASGADVFLSIHANAAGGGFLRAGGTSMFYHDPFWATLAESIYGRMLELGLGEFGAVGSFNYRPTRMSSVPSVLVEQAFMTHAEDEELLASDKGRRQIAQKVLAGLIDWLAEQPRAPAPESGGGELEDGR